jgi:hypothetical protein
MDGRAVCLLIRKQLFHRLRDPQPHGLAFHGAPYDDFGRLFDAIIAVKSKLDIHNGAVALRVMADLAMERLAETDRSDRVPSQS